MKGSALVSDEWWYMDERGQVGPLSLAQLRRNLAQLPDSHETPVWSAGFSEWTKAGLVPELADPQPAAPRIGDGTIQKTSTPRSIKPSRRGLVIAGGIGVVLVGSVGSWVAVNQRTPVSAKVTSPSALVAPALTPEREATLQSNETFTECGNCPEMVVMRAGSFMMGSLDTEPGRFADESPQHNVMIARPFAVGRFAVTFDEWDACVADGGCNGYKPDDNGWGRGRRPVIKVSWDDAKTYLAWLSQKTRKSYRLLSESEFEYVARAGTPTAYPWGDEVGKDNANCNPCGSMWDGKQTAPVGSFAANGFGLSDMAGNVWEWVDDCYQDTYNGAPIDGSARNSGDCAGRVVRGGAWNGSPRYLRSASRYWSATAERDGAVGFRVARTLSP